MRAAKAGGKKARRPDAAERVRPDAAERVRALHDTWYIREPALLMVLASHECAANGRIRGIRSGKGRVEYNPAWVDALDDAALERAFKAEAIRILLRHPYRYPPRDAAVSYRASNITLNEYYDGLDIPYHAVDFWPDPGHRRQNFEFYYRELIAREQFAKRNAGGDDGGGNAGGGDDGDGNAASASAGTRAGDDAAARGAGAKGDDDGGLRNAGGGGDSARDAGDDADGSSARDSDGDDDVERDDSDADGGVGDARDSDGDDDSDRDASAGERDGGRGDARDGDGDAGGRGDARDSDGDEKKDAEGAGLWSEDNFYDEKISEIVEYIQKNGVQWGSVKGSLAEAILAALHPDVDYRKVLAGFRSTALASARRLTRFRPSRRYGFLYMGARRAFTTSLLVGVDVSGSLSGKQIAAFFSVINRFFRYGVENVEVQQFDTVLQGDPVPMKKARKTVTARGRGGTSFGPIIAFFAENHRRYDGLIILTDGDAAVPDVPPALARRILWICASKGDYERHRDWMRERGRCCWIKKMDL